MSNLLRDVLVNDEGLIFKRGHILSASFVHPYYGAAYRHPARYATFLAKNYWLRRGARVVPNGTWVTDNFSPGSYHHWLIDSLPRLLAAEGLDPSERVVLLPRSVARQQYVRFTLQAFPQIHRVVVIPPRTKLRVGQLRIIKRPEEYSPTVLRDVATKIGGSEGDRG